MCQGGQNLSVNTGTGPDKSSFSLQGLPCIHAALSAVYLPSLRIFHSSLIALDGRGLRVPRKSPKQAVKMVSGLMETEYELRLIELGLATLEERCQRVAMQMIHKITACREWTGVYCMVLAHEWGSACHTEQGGPAKHKVQDGQVGDQKKLPVCQSD